MMPFTTKFCTRVRVFAGATTAASSQTTSRPSARWVRSRSGATTARATATWSPTVRRASRRAATQATRSARTTRATASSRQTWCRRTTVGRSRRRDETTPTEGTVRFSLSRRHARDARHPSPAPRSTISGPRPPEAGHGRRPQAVTANPKESRISKFTGSWNCLHKNS